MLRKISNKALLVFAGILFLVSLLFSFFHRSDSAALCDQAQKNLSLKEQNTLKALSWLVNSIEPGNIEFSEQLLSEKKYFDKEGIILLAYLNDSLKFWTSTLAPMDVPVKSLPSDNGMLHLRNGWYEYFTHQESSVKCLALLLIKPEYDVQNSYFHNDFADWLELPAQSEIQYPPAHQPYTLRSVKGTPLFAFTATADTGISPVFLPSLLFFIAFIIALLAAVRQSITGKVTVKLFASYSIIALLLRSAMIYFKFPSFLYHSALYDLSIYGITGSFFNEYLGDVLINVFLFFSWTIVYYKTVKTNDLSKSGRLLYLTIYLTVIILLALQLNATVKNLVISSTISLDFSSFFSLSFTSFLCLSIVFLNGFSILLHIEIFTATLLENKQKKSLLLVGAALVIYSSIYIVHFTPVFSIIEWFWMPVMLCLTIAFREYHFTQSILSAGFRILVFSIITSWIFGEYNSLSEEQSLKHLSEQLSDRQDALLESEFLKVSEKLNKDTLIYKALGRLPLQNGEIEQALRQQYFTRYFEKYNVQLTLFDSVCIPIIKSAGNSLNNHEYFEEQLTKSVPTICSSLFFIDNPKAGPRYIGKIEWDKEENKKASYTLYIQLEPKQFADAGSFSDLMLDALQQKQSKYKQFSYAIYRDGNLNSAYGKFIYPRFFNSSVFSGKNSQFKHQLLEPDENSKIIVTREQKTFNYYFTANSYYFLFYSVLSLLLFVIYHQIDNQAIPFFTLNRRIQFFIVSVLFLAMVSLGFFTVKLVIKKSEEDQVKLLTGKARQLQQILNSELFFNSKIDANSKIFTESVLQKYAELFNSDISIYNQNGLLFASSRPQLFTTGLSSRFINPYAVEHFQKNKSLYFITYDKIGNLNYLSLYTATYAGKQLSGYINLPYFARQNDLEEGLSDYITTLINIYVVLFLVSLFTGLIVSVYITKPLRILQEQLAKISLGKKNKPIAWHSEDEIGKLVNEYNNMLLKLEESAVLLARSEREGAWQEMAKQVAHEIKNPLTPMKLNIQYLQKIADQSDVNFEERFKKVAVSLIEQIDTLAHIANEFSNFAQMPKVNTEPVNLTEIISSTIELFKNYSHININFHSQGINAVISADKNQCLRVFNNLIKNAVQAIPEEKAGRIDISIKDEGISYLIGIKDNGTGIPPEMRDKIFAPNFTTKTTGTGLGLAMVKNIISAFNGEISFESVENEGTIFFLRFKKTQ